MRALLLIAAVALPTTSLGAKTLPHARQNLAPSIAPAAPKARAAGTLDRDDLIAIARLGSTGADDKFSDDPTLAFVGREFTFTVNPDDLTIGYDKSAHLLKVELSRYTDTLDLDKTRTVSQFRGQNAYGARAIVDKIRGVNFGVWVPGESYTRKGIQFQTPLETEEARALSKAVRLRISGSVVRADGVYGRKDSAIFEKSIMSDATIDTPRDVWLRGYYVAVTFTKAEWVDSRTGAVLELQAL